MSVRSIEVLVERGVTTQSSKFYAPKIVKGRLDEIHRDNAVAGKAVRLPSRLTRVALESIEGRTRDIVTRIRLTYWASRKLPDNHASGEHTFLSRRTENQLGRPNSRVFQR